MNISDLVIANYQDNINYQDKISKFDVEEDFFDIHDLIPADLIDKTLLITL